MRLVTRAEAVELDRRAQAQGLSGDLLMESAGALAAREIRRFIMESPELNSSNLRERLLEVSNDAFIAVVCGPGGNGGDGLVVARHLESAGFKVRAYFADASSKHELFRANLKRLPLTVARLSLNQSDELIAGYFDDQHTHHRPLLIIDALLGLGTSRDVQSVFKTFIESMNSSEASTISLDVPSGLECDRGEILGVAVVAKLTLTFGLAKRGFFVNEGPAHVGRLIVLPIGFPMSLVREVAVTQSAFGQRSARRFLPTRKASANKASHGRTAIFAGQHGMVGAGLLAGTGAMRTGVGYVTLITRLTPEDGATRIEIGQTAPEFLTLASSDPELWKKISKSATVVGPGFGVGEETLAILKKLSSDKTAHVVVDADALTTLANEKKAGRALPILKSWILTPHAGELARLIGGEAGELEADRFNACEEAARALGCIVVFKGFRTVVSDGRRTSVILAGNSALAKAGSGDILAGFIGGFLAQRVEPFDAACLAAYLHGRLADEWIKSGRDLLSLQPPDLAGSLPLLLKKIRGPSKSSGAM